MTVPDPVDCTYPTQITSVKPNPDGSVTVQAVLTAWFGPSLRVQPATRDVARVSSR